MKKPDINVEYTGVGLYKEPTNGYPLPGQEEWEVSSHHPLLELSPEEEDVSRL